MSARENANAKMSLQGVNRKISGIVDRSRKMSENARKLTIHGTAMNVKPKDEKHETGPRKQSDWLTGKEEEEPGFQRNTTEIDRDDRPARKNGTRSLGSKSEPNHPIDPPDVESGPKPRGSIKDHVSNARQSISRQIDLRKRSARKAYHTVKNFIPAFLLVAYSIISAMIINAIERNATVVLYNDQSNATCVGNDFWKALFYVNTLYTTIGQFERIIVLLDLPAFLGHHHPLLNFGGLVSLSLVFWV